MNQENGHRSRLNVPICSLLSIMNPTQLKPNQNNNHNHDDNAINRKVISTTIKNFHRPNIESVDSLAFIGYPKIIENQSNNDISFNKKRKSFENNTNEDLNKNTNKDIDIDITPTNSFIYLHRRRSEKIQKIFEPSAIQNIQNIPNIPTPMISANTTNPSHSTLSNKSYDPFSFKTNLITSPVIKRSVHIIDSFRWEKEKSNNIDNIRITIHKLNSQMIEQNRHLHKPILISDHLSQPINKSISDLCISRSYPKRQNVGLKSFHHNIENNLTKSISNNILASFHDDRNHIDYHILRNLGRGSYGYAVEAYTIDGDKKKNKVVLKIGYESTHVLWEILINRLLLNRMVSDEKSENIFNRYENHFLSPYALYSFSNTAFFVMDYASLGTLVAVNRSFSQSPAFLPVEHEWLVQYITLQMLEAVSCLHKYQIIHTDIKSDNWVIRYHPIHPVDIQILLIDFGKAKDLKIEYENSLIHNIFNNSNSSNNHDQASSTVINTPKGNQTMEQNNKIVTNLTNKSTFSSTKKKAVGLIIDNINTYTNSNNSKFNSIAFQGNAGAKGFSCYEMMEQKPWSYQSDYYGICACTHQMLFLEDLSVTKLLETELPLNLQRRGLDEKVIHRTIHAIHPKAIIYPKATFKRYWNREIWSTIYLSLLNHKHLSIPMSQPMSIESLITYIKIALETSSTNKDRKGLLYKLINRLQSLQIL